MCVCVNTAIVSRYVRETETFQGSGENEERTEGCRGTKNDDDAVLC